MKKLAALFLIALCARASAETYTSPELGFTFPATLSGMEMTGTTDFEKQQKGLGVGISYRGGGKKADFFIYNMGESNLPPGLSSPGIKSHFAQVKGDVVAMEKDGRYQNVAITIPSEKSSIGNLSFLHSELTYDQDGISRVSHVYLTSLKGQYFKIRFTVETTELDPVKSLQKFLADLAPILTTSNSF